jgi:conjugative transfer signal peptidase TraF
MNRAVAETEVHSRSGGAGEPRSPQSLRELLNILALGTVAALAVSAVLLARPSPRLVWNVSASASPGLYRVRPYRLPRAGDMVVAFPPRGARFLASSRNYLPWAVPLVKRVAAVAGDRVCERGAVVTINGRFAARRERQDALGRGLPCWTGCITLKQGDYFLLGDHRWSFDGRYFGITHANEVLGKADLL